MTATLGMCSTCYETVPAVRTEADGVAYLVKTCPVHGEQTAVIDTNAAFFNWTRNVAFDAAAVDARPKATMINVTNRCNMTCPQCYHQPDAREIDPSIDEIVALSKLVTLPTINMLGAEPTVRRDLPELIRAIKDGTGKRVSFYTNGLRMADEAYARSIIDTGVYSTAMSVHLPEYVGEALFEKKKRAIANIKGSGCYLWHVAFSVQTLADVGKVFDLARTMDLPPETYVRMRVTGAIGQDPGSTIYLSQLVQEFSRVLAERGLMGQVMKGSHSYCLITEVEGRHYYLLKWPSVAEVDIDDLKHCPARGLLIPELGETPLVHQMLLFAHRRSTRLLEAS